MPINHPSHWFVPFVTPNTVQLTSAATKYGCYHEKDVIQAYKLKMLETHTDFVWKCLQQALWSASIRHVLVNCLTISWKVCTVVRESWRLMPISHQVIAWTKQQKILQISVSQWQMKRTMLLKWNYSYFYEYQLQMMVTKRSYCDVVVWTPAGKLHVQRLFPDEKFLSSRPYSYHEQKGFWLAIMPGLLGK